MFPVCDYHFFPKSYCTSVNEVICRKIPDARKLEDGDVVNVDVSVYYKGCPCISAAGSLYLRVLRESYSDRTPFFRNLA
ncbi:hypothetical protein MKW98_018511 [Papaver atlanticum]|uniref:Peptidase M24 domain-containing protein n=1 Tax=Papaver atlanticum TaxID=357466 RepID=A0AAD4TG81_9MAGN|nr:hypothetical protein MKW98_018511 [Papaver atlanticum]